MNSNGDPSSPRGRARIPGPNGDQGPTADDSYQRRGPDGPGPQWQSPENGPGAGRSGGGDRPATSGPGRPASGSSGRASVGSASVGSASVGSAGVGSASGGSASGGSASAGRARVGRASVPGPAASPDGGGDGAPPTGRRSAGRASVGSAAVGAASVGGRATVGRAMVRPVSPAGPGGSDSTGPGTYGGRAGRRARPSDKLPPDAARKAKRRKRLNWAIASFAVFIMLAGIGVVSFTYYSTSLVLPDKIDMPLATTVYANDGKKELVKLGEQNRTFVTKDQIPDWVQKAVASAEDRNFYDHSGVDYKGIVRAAWNNLTGGSRQGASTITQQYARNAYESLNDDSYARKVKEAIFASKLTEEFDKPTIMQHYLNIIPFGRGAYGIEAAAQTYFGVSAQKLTVAQAAVLAALIKQPYADSVSGHKGYDPAVNPEVAKERWNYVLNGMQEKGWFPAGQARPTDAEYPKVLPLKEGNGLGNGVKTPVGNVVNYVYEEMAAMKLCTLGNDPASKLPNCVTAVREGGYKIKTTINAKMQTAAEAAAQRAKKNSVLADQPANLMAAMVAINPTNGHVLAYYGGDDGTGIDFAGKNTLNGALTGGHPPGSSFKIYTLAAGLQAGKSLQSHWKTANYKIPQTDITVVNAGRTASCKDWCSLEWSTVESYNVPFYHLTKEIGADKVVDMAKAAGITTMWSTKDNAALDLTKKKGSDVSPDPIWDMVAYGQYPVTVLDHANGVATLANRGKYNKAHFVVSIEQQNEATGKWEKVGGEQLKPQQRIEQPVADEVTSALTKIPGNSGLALSGGRPSAGKTGTWEYADTAFNADAWMVGYTPQLATAVWVGSKDSKKPMIKDKNGRSVGGAGLPGEIWQRFMNDALKGAEVKRFSPATGIGDPNSGNGASPPPPSTPGGGQPTNPNCPVPDPNNAFCNMIPGGPGATTNPGNPDDDNNRGGNGGGLLPSPTPRTRE
ncbi:transglycosylase domain-containing protein [Micromonospora sp. NPDC003197]